MGIIMENYREVCVRGTEDFPLSLYHFIRKNKITPSHWHPEIELLYVVGGEIMIYVSEERLLLKPGDICFVSPGEIHGFDVPDVGVEYYVAVFVPTLFQYKEKHFLEQDFMKPLTEGKLYLPRLVQSDHKEYSRIHDIVHHLFEQEESSKAMIYADLTMLFCEMMERSLFITRENAVGYRYSDAIKRCIRYMQSNYHNKVTLSEVADEVHMSPNYLCSYFKKYTGITIFNQLHLIRVRAAEQMLSESEESIVNVAVACGFENVSFFIRKFKEVTGETPSVYRKRMKTCTENLLL